jgi:hydroxymethylpyrimidine pyrophosphatase-like HAD family hydrolase
VSDASTPAESPEERLHSFLALSAYALQGGVITDLDGTVVHEVQGRVIIPEGVVLGLKELYDVGRPLVINTLRFPLSVLRTFGAEWYALANAPIPTVTLNGSQIGYITRSSAGELVFEEVAAFPLTAAEIDEVLAGVEGMLEGGLREILVFSYPRDWRLGEVIWTPSPERVAHVSQKYPSASAVSAVEFGKLRDQLHAEPICMLFLLIDVPRDRLMAYQHTRRSNFVTHEGVDKLSGAREIAARIGFDLPHSLGAGDTEMDTFLNGIGLAVLVGNAELEFRGALQTIRLPGVAELGELLFRLARIQRGEGL